MRTLFDGNAVSGGSAGSLSGTQTLHADNGVVVIPGRDILLQSMYARSGADLVLTSPENGKFIVKGFFLTDPPPTLTDSLGTSIHGDVAAQFAGSLAPEQYAGQAAALGAPIGQVRTLTGVVQATRADGTTVTLNVGDPVYLDDILETAAGANLGLTLIDGTALALGESGELVLDELVYDPSTQGGTATLSLISGAAEFVSGTIAKSGQDAMTFKTPVGTIGIRGTKVFASYDPVTQNVTILNRPTGVDAAGNETSGIIFLTLPDGTPIGQIATGNGGWQYQSGQTPVPVTFTPAQIQTIVAATENTINNVVQQQQTQPQNNIPGQAPGQGVVPGVGQPTPGDQPGGQQPGGPGQPGTPGAPVPGQQQGLVPGTPGTTTISLAPTTPTPTAPNAPGNNAVTTPTTPTTPTNPTTPTTPVQPVTPPVVTPPVILPAEFSVAGGGTVSDRTPGSIDFVITRSGNTTVAATVTYSTQDGSATGGSDYGAVSGSVTFAAGETSKVISVPILVSGRTEVAENFSFTISAGAGGIVTGNSSAGVTIAADPPLPTLSIDSVTVSDRQPGTAVLTVTRSGDVSAPSSVTYTTQGGSAQAGSDFTAASNTITFAAGQSSATISIAIAANSTPLTIANREGEESFTVVLSNPTDATIATGTGTVTISADPVVGLADFSISGGAGAEGDTVEITITRSGDLAGEVSVSYSTQDGSATAGADYGAASGSVTFAAGETSKSFTVSLVQDTSPPFEPGESFSVVLSNAVGGNIVGGSADVSIAADPPPVPPVPEPVELPTLAINDVTVSDTSPTNAVFTVTRTGDTAGVVTVNYATSGGSATSGVDFTSTSGTLTFAAGQTSATITVPILADSSGESAETFSVVLSNAVGATIADSSGIGTITADAVSANAPIIAGVFADNAYAQFDGSDIMITPGTLSLGSHTVETWLRLGGETGMPQSITALNGGGDIAYFYYDGGKITARLVHGSDDKEIESSITINDGEWTHVAYTYDDTTGDLKLYIDGVHDAAATIVSNDTFNFSSSGHFYVGSGGPPGLLGAVDQVRVWNTTRTAGEIAQNVHKVQPGGAAGLQIQYTFDNYGGTTAVNSAATGTPYNGNATGTYFSPADGDFALEFSGATHIYTGITQSPGSFTLQASVRLFDGDSSTRPIFSKATVSGGDDETFEFQVLIDSSNQLVLRMGQGESEGYDVYTGASLEPGISYDIAATYDNLTGDVGLYVNGELYVNGSGSLANFNQYARQHGNLPIEIGRTDSSSPEYFSGYITNVRIWDVVLDDAKIVDTNESGVAYTAGGLVAAYPFFNGVGNIVSDASGNGYAAQVFGPLNWTADGALVLKAIPGTINLPEDTGIATQLVAVDPNNLSLTYSASSGPAHGSLYVAANGLFRYLPNTNYVGTDTFTLQVENSNGDLTTQVFNINVTALNDRPQMDSMATMPGIYMDDFTSGGATIDSLFGSSFEDPDGTFVGVAVVSNTADPGSQGAWEYSTDGTNWHEIGTSVLDTSGGALFISKNTYVRFVPQAGYTGSPGGLIVRPIDQVYATAGGGWSVANASETRVTLQDAINNSRPVLLAAGPSFILITISAAPAVVAAWDGPSSGSWVTASNWDPDGVPGNTTEVTINGAYTVTLSNGTSNDIKSLNLTGATLDLNYGGTATSLAISQDAVLGSGATLNLNGSGTFAVTEDLQIAATAEVSIGDGAYAHSVEVTGDVENLGSIYLHQGTFEAYNFTNDGLFQITAPTATVTINGNFENQAGSTLGVYADGANTNITFQVYNNFDNYGLIKLSNLVASANDVTANFSGPTIQNRPGSVIRFEEGSGGGHRTFVGFISNYAESSPDADALIDVMYNATIDGGVNNGGEIHVASGQTLTIHDGTLSMTHSGQNGTFTGAGSIYFDDAGINSDAYFSTYNGFTLGATQSLIFGNYSGNNNARWMANGTTTINGTVTVNNAILEGSSARWILDGDMTVLGGFKPLNLSQTNTSNIHSRLSLSGDYAVAQDTLTITSNGTLSILGGDLGDDPSPSAPDDDETATAEFNGDVVNNGTITMSSSGADVWLLYYASNYSGANTEDPNNNRFYNFGTIDIQAGSGGRYVQATDIRNSGDFFVKKDTSYSGKFFNIDTLTLYGNAIFKFETNSDLYIKAGSTIVHSGGGVASIHIAGGQSSNFDESYVHFEESFDLTPDFKIILGATGTAYNFVSGFNMETGEVTTVTGEFLVHNGSISSDLDIGSGGQLNAQFGHGGGVSGDVIVRAGGTVHAEEVTGFSFSNQVDLLAGSNVEIEDSVSGSDTRLGFYGATNNQGTVTLSATGGSTKNAILEIGGLFTNMSGGTLNVGSQRVEMYSGDAILRNEVGGTLTLTSGGVIDMFEGHLELNRTSGAFDLVSGAKIVLGNIYASGASTLSGQTGGNDTVVNVYGSIDLVNAEIDAVLDIKSGGAVKAVDGAGVINTDLQIQSGGLLGIDLTPGNSGSITFTESVTNDGDIEFNVDTVSGTISVDAGGTLTNNGTITFTNANNGTGILGGEIDNNGSIVVAEGKAEITIGSANFDNNNTAQLTVENGGSLKFLHTTGNFINHLGATVDIQSGGVMIMNGTDITNSALATFNVDGTLYMGDGVNNGNDGGDFNNITTGILTGSGTIYMEGGGFSGLDGGVDVEPGNSPGHLTIYGDMALGRLSKLNIELAGRQQATQYDLLSVHGRFGIAGTLNVISYAGFAWAAGDQFDVVTWDSRDGIFKEVNGLDAVPDVALDMTFHDSGLTLTAKAITHDGAMGDDILIGSADNDVMVGRDGNDILDGGLGDDVLIGGLGDDLLRGGGGSNRLIGGEGFDTADYSAAEGAVHVNLYQGHAVTATGTDTLVSIEKLIGTGYADTIVGNAKDNVIVGGLGADTLTGGAGADQFIYLTPHDDEGGDTIRDFNAAEGDKIVLDASAFSFTHGSIVEGVNFATAFTYANDLLSGISSAWDAGLPTLIYASSGAGALYYDPDGHLSNEGYTVLVSNLNGSALNAGDIVLQNAVA